MARILILGTVLSLVVFGCSRDSEPVSPSAGGTSPALAKPGSGKSALDLIEDDYNAGLLEKNNACLYREYAVSSPDKLPAKYRSSVIGKDATYSMVQIAKSWNELSGSTRKEIAEIRASGFGALKESFTTSHFVLHYTTQSNFSVPTQDNDADGIPDFIEVAAESWEEVWTREISQLGFVSPRHTPGQKFHVYYKDMPYYGYTVPEDVELLALSPIPYGTAAAWIAVENDFYGFPRNDEDVTGMEPIRSGALKVTQAHEFMHAVQFNINVYQSGWLMESTATWAEEAVYGNVNDWHWYVDYFLRTPDYPIFSRYAYGSAFFITYLTERYGTDLVRLVWEAAKTQSTPDAVRSVAFGGTWEPMKSFAPAEYLLDLADFQIPSVVPQPTNFIRAAHSAYPVSVQVQPSTNKGANRAPWGLGANFVEFYPADGASLTLTFDGMDGFAWRAMVVATPARGGSSPTVWEIPLNGSSAGTLTVTGFGTKWGVVTLIPTIVERAGSEVPFAYTAEVK